MPSGAGRPRLSSERVLEDAAAELFLERGYSGTTIDDITRRAGVSRTTFFNYFGSKSDLLWVEFDTRVGVLSEHLAAQPIGSAVTEVLRTAILEVAGDFGDTAVPWAITHAEPMGTAEELAASGFARFSEQAAILQHVAGVRLGLDPVDLLPRALAFALLGAVTAAAGTWVEAGVERRPLREYVSLAIAPVCDGFAAMISGRPAA